MATQTNPTDPGVLPIWNADASAAGVTTAPARTTPADAYVDAGWPSGHIKPPRGYWNWWQFKIQSLARWLQLRGISTWRSADANYAAGDVVRDTVDNAVYQLVGT